MAPQDLEKKNQQTTNIADIYSRYSRCSKYRISSVNISRSFQKYSCLYGAPFCFAYPSPTVLGCLDISHHARSWQPKNRREPAKAGLPGNIRPAPCPLCCSARPCTRLQHESARRAGERGGLPRQIEGGKQTQQWVNWRVWPPLKPFLRT